MKSDEKQIERNEEAIGEKKEVNTISTDKIF